MDLELADAEHKIELPKAAEKYIWRSRMGIERAQAKVTKETWNGKADSSLKILSADKGRATVLMDAEKYKKNC